MKRLSLILLAILTVATGLLAADLTGTQVEKPANTFLLHKDDEFSFHGRHYGNRGDQKPGFFVYSIAADRWLSLGQVSTKGATFGYLPYKEEKFQMCSHPWDYRALARLEAIDLPLGKGGYLNFPRSFTDKGDSYLLLHNTDWNDDRVTTILTFSKDALRDLFKPANTPAVGG